MTMVHKKAEAIALRKKGKTYSEILQIIPVAKSTLSLWLRDIGLSRPQIQHISNKKMLGQKKGAEKRRQNRILLQKRIHGIAASEIKSISKRELWLIGIVLYWAEGSKEKEYKTGSGVTFSNSDPRMIKLFLRWLIEILHVAPIRLIFEVYIHENQRGDEKEIQNFWSRELGYPPKSFTRVYYKKHNPKTRRHNKGLLYHGLIRVKVSASSTIIRQIEGWIHGIIS